LIKFREGRKRGEKGGKKENPLTPRSWVDWDTLGCGFCLVGQLLFHPKDKMFSVRVTLNPGNREN